MKRIYPCVLLLMITILCSCSQDDSWEKAYKAQKEHYIAMWAQSLEPFENDIAFYGDSRVAGADWVTAFSAYDVVNLGIGGDRVSDLILRIPLVKALDIKHCFIAIGGNDCLASSFNLATFEAQYRELLDKLKPICPSLYLQTIAGVRNSISSNASSKIQKANEVIGKLASDYGLPLIDMASLMNTEAGELQDAYSSDGVHFSPAGNDLWYSTLRPYIEATIEP
jgi:lysophospholipase L1-like esterase